MNIIKVLQKKVRKKTVKNDKAQRKPLTLSPKYLDNIRSENIGSRTVEDKEHKNRNKTRRGNYPNLSHKKSKEIKRILLHLEREYML